MADLLLELRVKSTDAPPADSTGWLDIEVQTANTRPVGLVIWSEARTEGGCRIIPVTQGPLSRTLGRVIAVQIADRQVELFTPPMKRLPNPKSSAARNHRTAKKQQTAGGFARYEPILGIAGILQKSFLKFVVVFCSIRSYP